MCKFINFCIYYFSYDLGLKGVAKARELARTIIEHVYRKDKPSGKPTGESTNHMLIYEFVEQLEILDGLHLSVNGQEISRTNVIKNS